MSRVRIVTEELGGSNFSLAVQEGTVPSAWLAAGPRSVEGWRAQIEKRRTARDWASILRLLTPALQASGLAAERLERVIMEGGVVVTTGQQPGLFGGPMYTWNKAVSAIALADELERHTGKPTIAIYWAATDDSDYAEASATVVSGRGGARVLRSILAPPPNTPLTLAPLGDLRDAFRGLRNACGSMPDRRSYDAVVSSYADSARTSGDAFVALLRTLLGPLGMLVLDASHPAVGEISARTLGAARLRAVEIEAALLERERAIRAAGYAPQVDHVLGLSLVFIREGTTKRRLTVREAWNAPGEGIYSPTVLLRPLVERDVLPTVAYVGGPAELAYFAQVGTVADALGVEPPMIVPRWSCTLIEPRIDELLHRYGGSLPELQVPHLLETRLARAALTQRSQVSLDQLRINASELRDAIGDEAGSLGLDTVLEGAVRSLQHRTDRLERRMVAAIKRRDERMMLDIGTLRGALYPLGHRQERKLNLIPLVARHGQDLLQEMREAARVHAAHIVGVS